MTMGGWRLAESPFGNPFSVKDSGSGEAACAKFEAWVPRERPRLVDELHDALLAAARSTGKTHGLSCGCWCKNKRSEACDGDVLVKLLKQKHQNPSKVTGGAGSGT